MSDDIKLPKPPKLPAPHVEPPERTPTVTGVTYALLVVLIVVMAVQTVWLLSYGAQQREQAEQLATTQAVLVCEAHLTHDLRDAARIERKALQDLLNTPPLDPKLSAEERKAQIDKLIGQYNKRLSEAIEIRERIASCPAIPDQPVPK